MLIRAKSLFLALRLRFNRPTVYFDFSNIDYDLTSLQGIGGTKKTAKFAVFYFAPQKKTAKKKVEKPDLLRRKKDYSRGNEAQKEMTPKRNEAQRAMGPVGKWGPKGSWA